MKLSFAFSLYNITSFIGNNRTEPDWLMMHKGSHWNLARTNRRLEKFQKIPEDTHLCFLGKYKTERGKFEISLCKFFF